MVPTNRHYFVRILLASAVLLVVHAATAVEKSPGHNPPFAHPPFIVGADISWVQEQEDQGTRFSDHGEQKDILAILKDHGFNWIRLRLFCNPRSPKVIGQSYYPKWHGTLEDVKTNLTDLAGRSKQDIMIVEYSVPQIRQVNDVVRSLPGDKGLGTFIWEPTKWEGPALFDGQGNTKPEIDVYPKMVEDYGPKGH